MKKYPTTFIVLWLGCLCSLISLAAAAQSGENQGTKEIVESKNFAFTVIHESGGDFAVGSYYFHLINDSLSVQLPYHGNSGTAAYTFDDNGVIVHTKDFSYEVAPTKNGGSTIKINLRNNRITRAFTLRVNKKGYTVLTVDSVNKDSISFNGALTAL